MNDITSVHQTLGILGAFLVSYGGVTIYNRMKMKQMDGMQEEMKKN